MTAPIPLTSPSGDVYAYACSSCHHVAGGASMMFMPEAPGPWPNLVEMSLERATECCTCRGCGASKPRDFGSGCVPCDWWREFGRVWWYIGNGYADEKCAICGGMLNDYCRKTPACVDCGDGHGGSPGGRCRDCDLEHLGRA